MKKLLLTFAVSSFVLANIANASQDVQCPYPTVVASVGLNQVDRASMGVFVYGQDNYGTLQSWTFEVGVIPSDQSNQEAISTANTGLVSMGKVIGPLTDGGGGLCFYYSYMSSLVGVAAEGFTQSSKLQEYIQKTIKHD